MNNKESCAYSPFCAGASVFSATIPLLLFLLFFVFILSERQVSGVWLSDIFGHCFVFGTLPMYAIAMFIYWKTRKYALFFPRCHKLFSILIAIDTLILAINILLIIMIISYV